VVGLGLGLLAGMLHPLLLGIYAGIVGLYVLAILVESLVWGELRLGLPVAAGIVATHVVYGVWFVVGLLSPHLAEEKVGE